MDSRILGRPEYKSFFIIVLLFTFAVAFRPGLASNFIQNSYEITWIGEFNSTINFSTRQNIFSRFFDFLTGKETMRLLRPTSVLVSRSGLITLLDQEMRSVVQIDPVNKQMDFIHSSATMPFPSLLAVCSDGEDHIYFTDSQENQIYHQITPGDDPIILNESIQFKRPTGIAYHRQKREIWVVETGAHRVSVLDPAGNLLRSFGKRGLNSGEFNFPTFIWIDKNGIVYIVDTMNFRIHIMDPETNTISIFGEAGDGSGYFARPKGIATDSIGNIYVVDCLFHTVQIFDKQGNFLFHFGRQGQGKGEFWMPSGIYIDESDKIYIADSYNGRVQIFQLKKKESGGK